MVFANLEVFVTNVGCDSESRRNWYTNQVHLCEVSAFTTKQIPHVSFAFSMSVAEGINTFFAVHCLSIFYYN